MTSLEKLLDKNKISFYRLTKLMGDDPNTSTGNWIKKVRGQAPIDPADLNRLLNKVAEYREHNYVHVNIIHEAKKVWVV